MHCATRRAALRPRWLASATPTARRKDCVGQSPPMNKGGPRAAKPQDRPKNAPASANESPSGLSYAPSVTRDGGEHRSRRVQYPQADASRYEPVPGRGRPALSIRCPYCGGVHLGRLRDGSPAGGLRRTPCGKVWVVVRRTYRSKVNSGAAA